MGTGGGGAGRGRGSWGGGGAGRGGAGWGGLDDAQSFGVTKHVQVSRSHLKPAQQGL